MMTRPLYREARHAGRMAAIAHRLQGETPPECPFRTGKRRRYWQMGAAEANRTIDGLLDLSPAGMAAQQTSAQVSSQNG